MIPQNTAIRGSSTQTTFISLTGPIGTTTLVTMGEQTRLEDVTLNLTSTNHDNLVGIEFPGTTSQTAKLRTTVVTVDNRSAGDAGTSNITGILFSGTGSLNPSVFSFNSIKGSTINVYSDGSGNKRGILVSGSNQVSTRDTNIYVAAPTSNTSFAGSYVGIESAHAGNTGSIQLRSTTVGCVKPTGSQTYSASDILQTNPSTIVSPTYLASPGIQVGPGTDLVTKSAGGKPFSTFIYPTTIYYGLKGDLTTGGSPSGAYMWPGTQATTNNKFPDPGTNPRAGYRIQQPAILSGMSVFMGDGPGSGHTTTIEVHRTPVGGSYSATAIYQVIFSNLETEKHYYDTTQDFNAGDLLHVFISYTGGGGNTSHDIAVQIDMF